MKKIIFMTILTCIIMLGCQSDSDELLEVETTSSNNTEQLKSTVLWNEVIEAQLLEQRSQWTAYIAGKVVIYNSEARIEVANLLNEKNIALDRLLGANTNAPIFDAAFKQELRYYMENPGTNRNEIQEERPEGGISTCCTEGEDINVLESEFIEYMTIDNCVELYFPLSLNAKESIKLVTTTAHPLTNDLFNNGFARSPSANDGLATAITVANNVDFSIYGTIILARPTADSPKYCNYNHPVDNYTFFLGPYK